MIRNLLIYIFMIATLVSIPVSSQAVDIASLVSVPCDPPPPGR